MNLIKRIDLFFAKRRANAIIKKHRQHFRRVLLEREHFNRPHQQSVHLVSYPVERAHEYKIGPRYVAFLLAVLAAVSLINYFKG